MRALLEPGHGRAAAALGLLAAALTFLAALQLRSQEAVTLSLARLDPATLAFRIDDLHKADDALAATLAGLERQHSQLSRGGSAVSGALAQEERRLQMVEGLVAVRGPGVELKVDAPLDASDLQNTVDNLRLGGAEAVEINGVRVVTGTPITDAAGGPAVAGVLLRGPFDFRAVGDPGRLAQVSSLMTQSLRADPRVRSVGYMVSLNLTVDATVRQHPFVYGSPG